MLAGLAVDIVHLAGLDVAQSVLFVEEDSGKNQFLLAGEGGDHGRHLVGFNLTLGNANVVLVHDGFARLFGLLCRNTKQIQSAPCVTMFLRSQRRTQLDDAGSNGFGVQPFLSALAENVLELFGIVGSEQHVQLAEPRPDTRVKEIREFEVVGNANDARTGVLERGVHAGQIVQQVVAGLANEVIDFVKDDHKHTATAVHSSHKFVEDTVGGPTCKGNLILFKVLKQ